MQALHGKHLYPFAISALLWLALAAPASAQNDDTFDPISAGAVLDEIQTGISAAGVDAGYLDTARTDTIALQTLAATCEADATELRSRLEARYEPLKSIDGDVDTSVFDQYLEIKKLLDDSIGRQTQCAAVRDTAQQLTGSIIGLQNAISQQFLSNKDETVIAAMRDLPGRIRAIPAKLRSSVTLELIEGVTPVLLFWLLVGGGALAALFGLFIRHRFHRRYSAAVGDDATPQFRWLLPKPLAQHAPLMLEGATLIIILMATMQHASAELMVIRLAIGISMYGLGLVVIDWATGPLSPSAAVKGLIPDHVAPLRRRLRLLVFTLVASFVVLGTRWLAIRTVAPDVPGRATMIFLVAIALIYVIAYLGRIPGMRGRFRLMRYAGILTLIVGIFALLLGFHNFAGYLIHGVTRTGLALFLLWILLWGVFTLFDYLISQDTPSAIQVRKNLGMTDKAARTGLGFMQLAIDLIVWLSFVVFVVYVWDDSGTTLDSLYEYIVSGVSIGEMQLKPINIIVGILVFIGLLIVIGWIKRWIDRRWLQYIVVERGAREALITVFGYIGFIIAVLIGLTQAGVELGGLVWVSSALALGIGFGMQEIANNFISGLILLFERPIRIGDFVTVGKVEGYVRSIRMRATEIETQDNQNVLVPNSELISGQVTNWVLRNTSGRLQLQVGVAYGSDVEKVREILERVACDHAEVITDGSAPAPRALFMGFGDSSLDFELRVRIFRIERRYSVTSDINFAIDASFREAGVSIPFPQHDLHIVSYPLEDIAEKAVAAAAKDKQEEPPSPKVSSPVDNITRSHTEEVELPVDLQEAWTAITNIEMMQQWLVREGEFTPHIGGRFRLALLDGSDMSGRIDIFIPNRRMRIVVALREGEEPLPTGPITVSLQLREIKKGTRLIVTVAGIPADEDWEEDYKRSEMRWQEALKELRAVIREST